MERRAVPKDTDLPRREPSAEDVQHTNRINAKLKGLDDGSDPFAAAVRATRMPMVISDPRQADNPLVYVNDAFCQLTGYSREEAVGRNCRFLQGPNTDPATVATVRSAVDDGHSIEIDLYNYRKNGTGFWNRLLIAPVADADGSVAYFFASSVDVTFDRERLESYNRELLKANKRLTEEAAERERVEEAFRQSQKMEAVGQLTGGIAHDFNNMLQVIGGNLELLRRRLEQGRGHEADSFLDSAQEMVERAASLTNRLLAFARRQPLQVQPTVLDTLLPDMRELIQRTVGPGIEVELRMGDGNWTVQCDRNQLESAILNVAINARDAMPEGGELLISTAEIMVRDGGELGGEAAAPGNYVEIACRDTGAGMDAATKARAFEPFFTTKPFGQGTGLGLSQLYGFMRQSGGFARLESTHGTGTTVRLFLPQLDATPAQADTASGVAEQGRAGSGEVMLLVDDEQGLRSVAAEHLRELGYAVVEAEDGAAALSVLRSGQRVDLLVSDVGLPGGMNGRQVAEAACQRRPGLLTLLITGYAGSALDDQPGQGLQVMRKPFSLAQLSARIGAMLARAGGNERRGLTAGRRADPQDAGPSASR